MNYRLIFVGLIILLNSCSTYRTNDKQLKMFEGKYKKLAQAVEIEDENKIRELVKKHNLDVDFQLPVTGTTLLMWAVDNDKYTSSKTLLELGANPNLKNFDSETSALMFAANKYETSDYVRLLLKHGGDANDSSKFKGANHLRTPLIAASSTRLESVKLLVEHGADVNYMSHHRQTAVLYAINSSKIDIARYLIIEQGADFKKAVGVTIDGDSIYIVNDLRGCLFPLDSEDYKIKMEIVEFMKSQGVDYRSTPIPKHYYNNYDSTYLEKY